VLGLDGRGGAESFGDYLQWETWQQDSRQAEPTAGGEVAPAKLARGTEASSKKKLSYLEAREFSTIEERIAQAEELLQGKRAAVEDPSIASDAARLLSAHAEMEHAQKAVDELYARWAELEQKMS
jgi:ABC transport system ATP-binding/permease protein